VLEKVGEEQSSLSCEIWSVTKRPEERNIVRTIKRRNANWVRHILCRNCLLKHVIERKTEQRIEMTGRRGRRRKQLLDDSQEKRGRIESSKMMQ
jgi:hypothetical protein